jgi:hypothetical protein
MDKPITSLSMLRIKYDIRKAYTKKLLKGLRESP